MAGRALARAARSAATLAEAGSWAPASSCAELLGGRAASQGGAGPLTLAGGCPAAAAAAYSHRGFSAWAAPSSWAPQQQQQQQPWQQQRHSRRQWQQQQQQQQRGAASAQAAEAAATPGGGGGDGLALSDSAVERLKELQAQSSAPVLLRVTVEGGGCSGFQYEFSIEEGSAQLGPADRLFERDGVRVVCDDISLDFLKGAKVDYESDLMRSAFVVAANPNAASSCGCGSSFVAK